MNNAWILRNISSLIDAIEISQTLRNGLNWKIKSRQKSICANEKKLLWLLILLTFLDNLRQLLGEVLSYKSNEKFRNLQIFKSNIPLKHQRSISKVIMNLVSLILLVVERSGIAFTGRKFGNTPICDSYGTAFLPLLKASMSWRESCKL